MVKKNELSPQNKWGLSIEQLDRKYLDEIKKRMEEKNTNASILAYLRDQGIQISIWKMESYRKKNFPHTLTLRSQKALERANKNKKNISTTEYENETDAIAVQIQNLPDSLVLEDKQLYIDALITKINARIRHFDEIFVHTNRTGFDPKVDNIYQKYIELGKELTESKAKLAGELDTTKVTVVNIVDSQLSLLLDKIKCIVEKVAPEHLGEFKKELLQLYSKEQTIIDTEVVSENQQKNK